MNVPEESDSGVVPMSHSNKDGQLSAESGEGRLLIKENARPPDTLSTERDPRVTRVGGRAEGSTGNSPAPLCRHSSAIRAVCANERMYGSVRGAISNDRPYTTSLSSGWAVLRVTPKCTTRRRSCERITRTNRTRKVAVGTVKKSMATVCAR